MDLSKFRLPQLFTVAVLSITIFISFLFFVSKVDGIKLLYATGGSTYDSAAYGNFTQTLQAGVQLERQDLHALSASKLNKYDAIYVDPTLAQDSNWSEQSSKLMQFVAHGGHLLLENGFATRFPADFLGAGQVIDLNTASNSIPKSGAPGFAYPQVPYNVQGVQQTFRLFSDSYFKHNPLETLPGFQWGYGFVPSSGQAIVTLNEVALSLVHHVGHGSVLISSNFMPNRYFLTGYDMQSGMDPAQGFSQLAATYKAESKPVPGTTYFNKRDLPLEPYFDFSFAAANMQYRSELLAYVAKDNLGYSMRKVLGPYGRPAMAFQNHFEAMPAIAQEDGIAWAELLKKYQEIPSFTLVRNAFYWGQWRESVTVQLNTGTNAQPKFEGELPGSGYASGLHLMADGKPLRQALFPQYRDLASAIELPYRAYPAAADLNGDGRTDLLAGGADGFVYVYTNLGPNPAAYASEPPPEGATLPDTFGAAEKLMLASGKPLQLGPYSTVHVADTNGDGRPDLIVSDESGAVWILPQLASGKYGSPAAVKAGGKPVQLPGGPAAAAVADVNGDGKLDLVLGGADGRVWLYPGSGTNTLTLQSGRVIVTLPNGSTHAAPAVRDMNGDGRPDLVVGSNNGDLQVYLQDAGGAWTAQGPLAGATLNQVGNHAIVAGHYSVPLWLDVNHDGSDDLIIGGVEFGSSVAIDDPQFPYPEQLKAFIQYAKEHYLDLNPHVYVHNYKSAEQERTEVALHKQAFDKLGIPWLHPGTNQHTWRINNDDRLQTLQNEQQSSMWYNFGFLAAHSQVLSRPESIWSLPFLLEDQQSSTDRTMLVHTPTPVLRTGDYATTDIFDTMVKLDMPIDYFEHIEYHFPEPAKIADLTQFADYFSKVRTQYDYNFMTETQMAQSFLTAMKSDAHISQSWASYIWNKLKDRLSHGTPHWRATITSDARKVPGLAGGYAGTLGVVIEKGEKLAQYSLESDSDIYTTQDNRIYIGLPKAASIGIQPVTDRFHLVRANVPFTMNGDSGSRQIHLQAAGLQQLKIYSPQELQFEGLGDATIEHDNQSHTYTITRYGDSVTFTLKKAQTP